jgi:glycosyltransferase involved in cell wall biosynthesis
MGSSTVIVHFWAGCPKSPNSKWQRFLEVVRRCNKEGWKNYLIWSKMPDNPALYEPFVKEGCEIILQNHSKGNFDLNSIWRTYKLLRHLKCDIFHCHNDHTSPLIGAALAKVPVRIWSKLAMSSDYETDTKPKGLHRLILSTRISCLCANRVLAISDKVRDELIDSVGFSKKIETVYVPVDFQRFADAAKGKIREELRLDESNIVITSVAHAVPVKGWDIAIKAFKSVSQRYQNAHLLLVGDSTSLEYKNQLLELIKNNNLASKVYFTGKRDDIPEILKASDIFVLPSRSDGLCCALIEAMASSLPCVAANVGGIPEVISKSENGLLFEREDSHLLAESIIKLIQDQTFKKKLALQASIRARDFSMELYVDKVFNIYRSLSNTGRK